jgi:very-short-patch-repair endonuclease
MNRLHNRIRGTTPEIENAARQLRHRLTPAETKLWQALKNRQLGDQHPIGRFIVDFYCPACRLIIEIDGGIHQLQQEYDLARTDHLQEYGHTVMRFSNEVVENDLDSVLATIYKQSPIQI